MATELRLLVARKVLDAVCKNGGTKFDVNRLAWCVRFADLSGNKEIQLGTTSPQLQLPFRNLYMSGFVKTLSISDLPNWAFNLAKQVNSSGDKHISHLLVTKNSIQMQLNPSTISECILGKIFKEKEQYGSSSVMYKYDSRSHSEIEEKGCKQKYVFEYSSPNIAKPFHIGHLRGTVIGNFLANLHEFLGHDVTRLNYLGDWGKQFGLLAVGFEKYGSKEELNSNPIKHLFDVYVAINKDAKKDPEVENMANKYFCQMEQGDQSLLQFWQTCRQHSIRELESIYKKLGVKFDRYDAESSYHKDSSELVKSLASDCILEYNDEGVGYMSVDTEKEKQVKVSLVKSDGTTLYITRDIVAAVDRYNTYKFNRMFYMVDHGQHIHFQHLFAVLQKLGHKWANRPVTDWHVKFGRCYGMKTREGDVVFLRDLLDEAKAKMLMRMRQTSTTAQDINEEEVAEQLAVSAVVVQDLKNRRLKSYSFNWDEALNFNGDTGLLLQYTHCRLFRIEELNYCSLDQSANLTLLMEPEAQILTAHLARWDEVINKTLVELEPCHVVQYQFKLVRLVGKALQKLRVKGEEEEKAKANLLLYHCCRMVLAQGLNLMGLPAMEKV